jgi:hypothetical protein
MQLTTVNLGQWKPGQSGNLSRRPVGSRHQFSGAFLRGLAEVWLAEGRGTILHTAKTQPATFFAVCARLIPSDVKLTLSRPMVGFRPKTMRCLGQSERQSPTPTIRAPQAVLVCVSDRSGLLKSSR